MTPKYTEEQFKAAKTRDKLPLLCEQCGKIFLMKKNGIIRALNSENGGRFCSFECIGKNKTKNNTYNFNCTTCGKNILIKLCDFNRSKNKNFFCSRECTYIYKSKKSSNTLKCTNCKKEIIVKNSRLKKSKSGNAFCSHECSSIYNGKFIDKEKSLYVDVSCANCSNQKRIRQKHFENCKSKKFFCNYECSRQYKIKHNYNKGKSSSIKTSCPICGKEIYILPLKISKNKSGKTFCSKKCLNKYRSEIKSCEKVISKCVHCGKDIKRLRSKMNKNLKNFCSRKCSSEHNIKKIKTTCYNCKKDIMVRRDKYENSISKRFFCGKECCNSWMSLHGDKISLMEKYLRNKISTEYPNLPVKYNLRNLLGFPYEFDFYFPTLNLLVEINGIGHYEPIYGKNKLKVLQNIQRKDKLKIEFCEKNNFNFLVINTSTAKRNFTNKNIVQDYLWSSYWISLKNSIDKELNKTTSQDSVA